MDERDRTRWPGGVMTGYIQWICEQWRHWAAETSESRQNLSTAQHQRFDAWLNQMTVKQPSNKAEELNAKQPGRRGRKETVGA